MKNKYLHLMMIALLSVGSMASVKSQNYLVLGAAELTTTDPRYPSQTKYVMRVFAYKGTGGTQTNYLPHYVIDYSYDASKLKNPEYFAWKDQAGPVLPVNDPYSLTQGIYTLTVGADTDDVGTTMDDGTDVKHHEIDVNSSVCSTANIAMQFSSTVTEYEIFRVYFDLNTTSPPSLTSSVWYDPSATGALIVPGPGNLTPQGPAAIPTTSPASPPWLVYTYENVNSNWEICNTTSGNPKAWTSADQGGLVFGFGVPLPVNMLDYTLTRENTGIEVKWTTAQEMNNDYFVVEHSTNGTTWNNLTEVDGAGNSMVKHSYSYTHQNPAEGVNFYRVRQVAFNGSTEYSPVKAVNNSSTNSGLNLFPNPAQNQVNIMYASMNGGKSTLSITDAFGREVFRDVNFESMVTLDGKMLCNGMYFVRVTDAGQIYTQKLLIQK